LDLSLQGVSRINLAFPDERLMRVCEWLICLQMTRHNGMQCEMKLHAMMRLWLIAYARARCPKLSGKSISPGPKAQSGAWWPRAGLPA
jgi:hypothetical protein